MSDETNEKVRKHYEADYYTCEEFLAGRNGSFQLREKMNLFLICSKLRLLLLLRGICSNQVQSQTFDCKI